MIRIARVALIASLLAACGADGPPEPFGTEDATEGSIGISGTITVGGVF